MGFECVGAKNFSPLQAGFHIVNIPKILPNRILTNG